MDGGASLQRIQALAVVQVPQDGGLVLATRRAQGAIGRHGHRVQVTSVANQVRFQLAVGQAPDLDQLVPTTGHDHGVLRRWGEAHTGHPITVAVLLQHVLAFALPQ